LVSSLVSVGLTLRLSPAAAFGGSVEQTKPTQIHAALI
jgi:hypothetical protein